MTDIEKVRFYINDKDAIRFTDEEIQMFLDDNECIYCAISDIWTIISTQSDISGTRKYTVGTESYEKSSSDDQVKAALRNADYFRGKCVCDNDSSIGGSFMLRVGTTL